MSKEVKRNQGFTLFESLLVLLIVSGLLLFPLLKGQSLQEKNAERLFFKSFERSLVRSQTAAILTFKICRVQAQVGQDAIEMSLVDGTGKKITEFLNLPNTVTSLKTTTVAFKAGSGNIQKIVSFKFQSERAKKVIQYQFYLGSGRFAKKILPAS